MTVRIRILRYMPVITFVRNDYISFWELIFQKCIWYSIPSPYTNFIIDLFPYGIKISKNESYRHLVPTSDGGSAHRKVSTYRRHHNTQKRGHESMPQEQFNLDSPMLERFSTERTSEQAATAITCCRTYGSILNETSSVADMCAAIRNSTTSACDMLMQLMC
jgi:hypothetical protein